MALRLSRDCLPNLLIRSPKLILVPKPLGVRSARIEFSIDKDADREPGNGREFGLHAFQDRQYRIQLLGLDELVSGMPGPELAMDLSGMINVIGKIWHLGL